VRYSLSELKDIIRDRRTVFPIHFSTRKVQKEIIDELLNVAIWAPTHGSTQPWDFKVFTDEGREVLSKNLSAIYKKILPEEEHKPMKIAKLENRPMQSSVCIAISMKRTQDTKIHRLDEIGAVNAGIQNMLLLATAHGIGSFWSTPFLIRSNEFKSFLNLSEEDECLGLIYFGYPKDEWPMKGQRRPIDYSTTYISEK
jgi:nitroreductase